MQWMPPSGSAANQGGDRQMPITFVNHLERQVAVDGGPEVRIPFIPKVLDKAAVPAR